MFDFWERPMIERLVETFGAQEHFTHVDNHGEPVDPQQIAVGKMFFLLQKFCLEEY